MDSTEKRGHGNSRFGEQSPEMTTGQPGLGVASPEWTRRKASSRKDISKIQMEVTCLNIVALLGSSRGELVMGTQNYESKIIIIIKVNTSGENKKSHAKGSVMLSWNRLTNVPLENKKTRYLSNLD